MSYKPSKLETFWVNHVEALQNPDKNWGKGCEAVKQQEQQHRDWLSLLKEFEASNDHVFDIESKTGSSELSALVFESTCTKAVRIVFIEPLVSFLRSPLAVCIDDTTHTALDKSWLLLGFPKLPIPGHGAHLKVSGKRASNLLFDVGASLYRSGAGGASQEFLYNLYYHHGREFDQIYGW